MQKRDVLNSPRLLKLKKHRRWVVLSKIFLYLFLLLIIFFSLAYISRTPSLNISSVEITGNKIVDTEAIKIAVKKEIAGNYLWFFPKTNLFLYPEKNIENNLHGEFKRLKDINFLLENNKILKISVTERIALYIWCEDTPTTETEKCYFLDDTGYIFDEAPYFSEGVYFKFYGSDFLETNLKKLISFKKTLETMGLKPVALYKEENGDVKIFLSTKNSSSTEPEIIFKIDSDLSIMAENLQMALNTEPLRSNFENKYSSLLYIDLRFGNKVYYKFR